MSRSEGRYSLTSYFLVKMNIFCDNSTPIVCEDLNDILSIDLCSLSEQSGSSCAENFIKNPYSAKTQSTNSSPLRKVSEENTVISTLETVEQSLLSDISISDFLPSILEDIRHNKESQAEQTEVTDVTELLVPKNEPVDCYISEEEIPLENIVVKSEEGLILCPICGNEAGKHVHYGGRACTSCRAFFRRSVQQDAYKKFFCSLKNCKIDSKSWRSCKWCRFERCIKSGLQPGWVLSDSERLERQEKRVSKHGKKKHKPRALAEQAVVPFCYSSDKMSWKFSDAELSSIQLKMDEAFKKMVRNLVHYYANNKTLFNKLCRATYTGAVVPYRIYKKWELIWPSTVQSLASDESKLSTLCASDNQALIRENFPTVHIILQSSLMINQHDFRSSCLGEIFRRSLLNDPGDLDADEVSSLFQVFQELNVGGRLPKGPLTYDQLFSSPWAENFSLEENHAKLTADIGSWPLDTTSPTNPVDYVKMFLLCNIFLLSAEGVPLKDPHKVSRLQDLHLNMLLRYLRFKYGDDKANSCLLEGLKLLPMTREVLQIRKHRLPV